MNCYTIEGDEVACSSQNCIGQDCTSGNPQGGNEVGSITFGSGYNSWGLEGLWAMNEEQFNDWFQDYLPWGDTIPGLTDQGAANPQLVTSGQAEYLASLFQGYDQFEEMMLQTEMWENTAQMNEMFDLWDESADLILASKEDRANAITDKKQELLLSQESLEDEMSGWKNKGAIIDLVKQQRIAQGQSPEDGIASDKEQELYKDAIVDTLTSWYTTENFKDKAFQTEAELLDSRNLADLYSRQYDKDKKAAMKEAQIQSQIDQMQFSNLHRINDLRDAYEADIYNQLAMFGSSQAFFDSDLPSYGRGPTSEEEFNDPDCWIEEVYVCG